MLEKKVLKNNVRLLTIPLAETKTAALLVMFKVGSRNENDNVRGGSHFIEHLMFKGTAKRPDTLSLSKVLDGVGAEYNAFTGKDFTGYYIKTDTQHLSLAIDILSDMLLNSKFDPQEMEREKKVIIEEINMYEDNPLMYIEDLLEQLMFKGNNLGWEIAGSKKSVDQMKREDVLAFKKEFYHGGNTVIGLSGNFSSDQVEEIEEKFNFDAQGNEGMIAKNIDQQINPQTIIKYKDTEQVQVALGFRSYAYLDPKLYALQLLSVILGGNMSSRLFLSVREKNGLAYLIRSWINVYEDTGNFVIQAGLDKARIEEAIKLILKELAEIKNGVSADELDRAKEYLSGKTALDLEDSYHMASWYVQQELFTKQLLSPEEKLAKIKNVNLDDIKNVAQEIIDFSKINLAIIGPFKDDEPFKKLITI